MKKLALLILAAAVMLTGALFGTDGAMARGRNTSATGPGGQTVNRDVNAGMTSEGYQRNVTTTGPGGGGASRGSTTTRSGHSPSTTTNVKGPAGNSGTINSTTTVTR